MTTQQIWLDCDGVLADFEKRATEIFGMAPGDFEKMNGEKAFWDTLYATEDLFTNLELMDDAHELVDAVRHLCPIILTGCPRGGWAPAQKKIWRDKHFPGIPMLCIASAEKKKFCQPGDILIDDWHKYKHLWEEAGGHFILHTSAEVSINTLKDMGVL